MPIKTLLDGGGGGSSGGEGGGGIGGCGCGHGAIGFRVDAETDPTVGMACLSQHAELKSNASVRLIKERHTGETQ